MIFRRKKTIEKEMLEQRLDTISELTRGLGRTEFNNLMEAVKLVFEARQKLQRVKTTDEKDLDDIDEIEKKLEKESAK